MHLPTPGWNPSRVPSDGNSAQVSAAHADTVQPPAQTLADNVSSGPSPPPASVSGYDQLELLGRGSMGIVYKARQTGLGRHVALKMILADTRGDREALQRFTNEARALAALRHPNIVQIYDIDLAHSTPYFAMELVEGGTLADRLGGRPQAARTAAQLILTLARAIHLAHQTGIVHRDLKPGNILLPSPDVRDSAVCRLGAELGLLPQDAGFAAPKITDFGLAKDLSADGGQTESGVIMGTPNYMAPEQAEGKSRDVGPAADVYALGAILYEMLTGRPPFTAESRMDTLLLLFHAEPVAPSQLQPKVPRDLETICLKCLHKMPGRRYASAEALADDLGRFLAGEPIHARPASLREKAVKWARRRPVLAASLVGCVLAVAGALGFGAWHQFELQEQLGDALQKERDSRDAEVAATGRERVAELRGKGSDLAHAAEVALAARDWGAARVHLSRAREALGDEPELADLRGRVDGLSHRADRQRADHERLERFLDRRNEALFHATLFTGGGPGDAGREARAATDALAQFGVAPGTTGAPTVDSPFYTDRQKAEIVEGCYELLVVLADAVARPHPGQPVDANRRQAESAVRVLDRAAGLDVTTQAYHRRRAEYLALAGRPEDSAAERERADAVRPSTALDHFLLGQVLYRAGDATRAVAAFESALQVQPDHFWARYYLGLSWLRGGRADQTITCLTACLAQRREFPWVYLLRASAWAELGQYERAETDFDTAARSELPESARYALLINRGVLRVRQNRIADAGADLREAVALRPGQYQGYLNLAQSHLRAREFDAALAQLDEAVRREPELASLYRTRARLRLLRSEPDDALADFDEAIRRETAPSLAVAEDHLDRARILAARKDYAKALASAEAAATLRPRDNRAARLRAEALVGLDRPADALRALDDCLTFGPPDAGAFRARAALRTRVGQYPGAQTDYTRAIELTPDAATYAARGWCYLVAGAPRLAVPDFDEAVRLAPEVGDAYAGRGYARALLGDHEQAVADADKALKCGPESSRLCYNVARIYAQAVGRLDRRAAYLSATDAVARPDWEERCTRALARAVELLPAAEAAAFWRGTVGTDRAFDPVRRGAGFAQLSTRYPAPSPEKPRRD
jgi:eukaryotic-like serine/threonine-protein kinase